MEGNTILITILTARKLEAKLFNEKNDCFTRFCKPLFS